MEKAAEPVRIVAALRQIAYAEWCQDCRRRVQKMWKMTQEFKSCVSRVLSGSSLEHSHIEKDSGVDSRVVRDTSQAAICSALTHHEQEEEDSPEQIFAVWLQ